MVGRENKEEEISKSSEPREMKKTPQDSTLTIQSAADSEGKRDI